MILIFQGGCNHISLTSGPYNMMFNITRSNYLALWYITNEMSIMDALDYITTTALLPAHFNQTDQYWPHTSLWREERKEEQQLGRNNE